MGKEILKGRILKRFTYFVLAATMIMALSIGFVSANAAEANASTDYLCFSAEEAGATVCLKLDVSCLEDETVNEIHLEYSADKNNWSDYTVGEAITLANIGDKVYFRSKNTNYTFSSEEYYYYFVLDKQIAASGNIMSLLNNSCSETTLPPYAFRWLFCDCRTLTSAPELPATTLAKECYFSMFTNCSSLTSAPELPATNLAEYCYDTMFEGCSSLAAAPVLPATTLADYCYYQMFYKCSSLTSAPALPATNLAEACYGGMFAISGLTRAPALPATTLADSCYYEMFYGCTSLIMKKNSEEGCSSKWEINATNEADDWNLRMFDACTDIPDSEPGINTSWFTGSVSYAISNQTPERDHSTNGGYISIDGYASNGSTVTFTVTADNGYELDTLTYNDGTVNQTITEHSFSMPEASVTVSASFKHKQHGNWTYSADGNKLYATCGKNGTCTLTDKKISLTLIKNEALSTYTGQAENWLTLSEDEKTVWTSTAGFDPLPSIEYYLSDGVTSTSSENSGAATEKAAPVYAGSYVAKITKETASASVSFTIAKKELTSADLSYTAPSDLVYDNSEKSATITAASDRKGVGEITIEYYNGDLKADSVKNVGNYTIKVNVSSGKNYTAASDLTDASWTFAITKADGNVKAPVAKTLIYTGEAQKLVDAGSSDTGTIQYKLGADATYSTEIPVAKEAGTYMVYYKVIGDENHNDVSESSVSTTIFPSSIVSFDSNGGSTVDAIRVKNGDKLTKPADPVRSGYTFAGWYKDNTCTESWNFDSDLLAQDTLLYAKWYSHAFSWSSDYKTCEIIYTSTINNNDTVKYDCTVTSKVKKEATCTTRGITSYTASYDNISESKDVEDIAATGHTLKKVAARAATTTATGNKEYYKCSVCGQLFLDSAGKTATNLAKVTIAKLTKKTNPMKLKAASKTLKYVSLKKKAATVSISFSRKAQGKVIFALSKSAKKAGMKVSSKGKISVPKKCKKGSYKITVKAAGNGKYKTASKIFTVKVK